MNEVTDERSYLDRAKKIKLLLLDVDGVLTDGKLYFSNSGEESKAFNILDGHGLKMLQEYGVQVGIITGRKSELVARRAADLGIDIVVQGSEDKRMSADAIRDKLKLNWDQMAYMGDDYPDLAVMCRCGLALTVNNAHRAVSARAHWQTKKNGGEGAVREACDMILQAQGKYEAALEKYLR